MLTFVYVIKQEEEEVQSQASALPTETVPGKTEIIRKCQIKQCHISFKHLKGLKLLPKSNQTF